MSKIIIVSNRLPLTVKVSENKLTCSVSNGGLATGLASLMDHKETIWIGWHGCTEPLELELSNALDHELRKQRFEPVALSADELTGYYKNISNGVIWPLFHYQVDKIPLSLQGWDSYESVNRRFAEAVAKQYQEGDFVWIHDFHLFLVPALVRELVPNARIGFFLHIPFPSCEILRIFPWRKDILRGIMGADIIGFHTRGYARNFQDSLLSVLGVDFIADKVRYDDREIRIGSFPLGVNVPRLAKLAEWNSTDLTESLLRLKGESKIQKIILSVDRMDYTKGIPRKLLAIETLLDEHEELRGAIVFIQIAAPSRDDVPAYEEARENVESLVGRINGKYSLPGYQPIHYISRAYPQEEIFGLYRMIDIMMVTPLRDGMNLVAKEFVAVRDDLDGVLILSEFAGASEELSEAILVNPYDISGSASGIFQAISMQKMERASRMKLLRKKIAQFDASTWARRFIDFFEGDPDENSGESYDYASYLSGLITETSERILLFLDYDGTLFPIVRVPQMAKPDRPLLNLLAALSSQDLFEIHILSGRGMETMEEWFPFTQIHLHAEHGAISRPAGSDQWISVLDPSESEQWKPFARTILEDYVRTTEGSSIEEKQHSLVWHYRMAEVSQAEEMANALRVQARAFLAPLGLEVLAGKKAIEIRKLGINKGRVIKRILSDRSENIFPVAIGDDVTDEDMFHALARKGMTVVVGAHKSNAKYRLRDPAEVRLFLESLANAGSKHKKDCG